MKNSCKVTILYLYQLFFWLTISSIFFDKYSVLMLGRSKGPDSMMIGIEGLIYLLVPYVFVMLILSGISTWILTATTKLKTNKLLIIGSLFVIIQILVFLVFIPFNKSSNLLAFKMKYLKVEVNTSGETNAGFSDINDITFESENWFLDKVFSDKVSLKLIEKHFSNGSPLIIELRSGLSILPYSIFKNYYKVGKSLYDVTRAGFEVNTKVNGKNLLIKTPENLKKPYLKVANSVKFGSHHLGLHIKIQNTNDSFLIFFKGKGVNKNKKSADEDGLFIKEFQKLQTVIIDSNES